MKADKRSKIRKLPSRPRELEKPSSIPVQVKGSCSASIGLVSFSFFALPSLPEPVEKSVQQLSELHKQFITALWVSKGSNKADGIPEWATNAREKFIRCYFGLPKLKKAQSKTFQAGYFLGFVQGILVQNISAQAFEVSPALLKFFQGSQFLQDASAAIKQSPIIGRAEFHAGYSCGLERSTNVDAVNAAIHLLLYTKWREVQKFQKREQCDKWIGSNTKPNVADRSDGLHKMYSRIGLRFSHKRERPK